MWKIYALLNNGVISDFVAYAFDDSGAIKSKIEAVRRFGEVGDSFDITNYHATIGDTVANGKVYRNGTELELFPTEAAIVASHTASIAELNDAVDDIIIELLGG